MHKGSNGLPERGVVMFRRIWGEICVLADRARFWINSVHGGDVRDCLVVTGLLFLICVVLLAITFCFTGPAIWQLLDPKRR